jgi:hypothetical protein
VAAFAALLREDVRQAMPSFAFWFDGRQAVAGSPATLEKPDDRFSDLFRALSRTRSRARSTRRPYSPAPSATFRR